jgi:NAD(P)H-dependent FMN reductase
VQDKKTHHITSDVPNVASDSFRFPRSFGAVPGTTIGPESCCFTGPYGSARSVVSPRRKLPACSGPVRDLSAWSEGQVWCSPERHGAMTGIMKAQIDWIPLSLGAMRPTQGKTLAVMQVSGGSQSFNAVNQLRVLGRWMRMITIPNQSSVAKAYEQFDDRGRMRPSAYYDRIVDVMEELVKFTLLRRGASSYLTDRYSERKEAAAKLAERMRLDEAI